MSTVNQIVALSLGNEGVHNVAKLEERKGIIEFNCDVTENPWEYSKVIQVGGRLVPVCDYFENLEDVLSLLSIEDLPTELTSQVGSHLSLTIGQDGTEKTALIETLILDLKEGSIVKGGQLLEVSIH